MWECVEYLSITAGRSSNLPRINNRLTRQSENRPLSSSSWCAAWSYSLTSKDKVYFKTRWLCAVWVREMKRRGCYQPFIWLSDQSQHHAVSMRWQGQWRRCTELEVKYFMFCRKQRHKAKAVKGEIVKKTFFSLPTLSATWEVWEFFFILTKNNSASDISISVL